MKRSRTSPGHRNEGIAHAAVDGGVWVACASRERRIVRLKTVTSTGSSRLRIAAIDFLNPAPLMWDFEHEPAQSRLAEHYSIHRTMPSECAAQLESGESDIGLIPIASYATIAGLSIIPGCTIASLDRVRSILLVVRTGSGVEPRKNSGGGYLFVDLAGIHANSF